jgi:hypothetical protein
MMRGGLVAGVLAALGTLPVAVAQGSKQFIQVELVKTIKAKKAKVGDVVKARAVQAVTLPGGVTISEGTAVLGEVRAADEKSLAISFDQAEIQGEATPVKLSIRSAMMPGASTATTPAGSGSSTLDAATPGNRPIRGGPPPPRTVTETVSEGPASAPRNVAAQTGSLIGMPGITLEVDEGPQRASKFVSADKELQLKSGLQLMLAVVP